MKKVALTAIAIIMTTTAFAYSSYKDGEDQSLMARYMRGEISTNQYVDATIGPMNQNDGCCHRYGY